MQSCQIVMFSRVRQKTNTHRFSDQHFLHVQVQYKHSTSITYRYIRTQYVLVPGVGIAILVLQYMHVDDSVLYSYSRSAQACVFRVST